MLSLQDACILRSNELTKILAGCIAVNPLKVLPMVEKLRPDSLTDNVAKEFILTMKDRLSELQQVDYDHQGITFVEWATDHHCLFDYALWITEVKDSILDAENAIRELKKLAIALNTVGELQDWIQAREAYIRGG